MVCIQYTEMRTRLHSYTYMIGMGQRKLVLFTRNTPVHIMAPILYSVYGTQIL